jgi:hypothetical protein
MRDWHRPRNPSLSLTQIVLPIAIPNGACERGFEEEIRGFANEEGD